MGARVAGDLRTQLHYLRGLVALTTPEAVDTTKVHQSTARGLRPELAGPRCTPRKSTEAKPASPHGLEAVPAALAGFTAATEKYVEQRRGLAAGLWPWQTQRPLPPRSKSPWGRVQ